MPSVGLYTLGCKVSQYETEALAERFADEGFTVLDFSDVCDVYVVNTCTVTAESDRKSRQVIRRAITKNPEATVLVMGCYSQEDPNAVAAIPGVNAVIGTADKMTLVSVAKTILENKKRGIVNNTYVSVKNLAEEPFEPMCVRGTPRTRAYVKIEDGCECRCTYCAISAARGPVRSKPMEEIVKEVEALSDIGTLEVVLTGIETSSWGADLPGRPHLSDLLETLDKRKSCYQIRLGSLTPEAVTEDFAERVSKLSILTPHFHLSVQAASDAVLRGMKRRYSREMLFAAVERLRARIPGVCFTADLMVGFPGESEEDFLQTVDFAERARLLDAHVFAYSKRPGTPAATYPDQVPEAVKHDRSARLIAVKNRVREGILSEAVGAGKPIPVIAESFEKGAYTAHTPSYMEVRFEGPRGLSGRALTVLPTGQKDGVLLAELVK